AGLGAVEAPLLGDGDAEVVAEGVDHGGADAAARRRPRHDDAVTAEEDEIAQKIGPEEAARLLFPDDDVVRLRRDLVHDLVAVAQGPRDAGRFFGAAVLPGPAPRIPVIGTAHASGVDDGHALSVRGVDQLTDAGDAVPGLGAAGVPPALDRFEDGL